MPTYVALLRGINVGGNNKIKMVKLVASLEKRKLKNVVTYIQSGNLIFEDAKSSTSSLEAKISSAINKDFGFDVPVIVLTSTEFKKIAAKHPFGSETGDEKSLYITVLGEKPKSSLVKELKKKAQSWPDKFKIVGRTVFVRCSGGYRDTKLTNNFIEKMLNVKATSRNWRSTGKILAMLESNEG